ncbi:MAG TPA: glycosyltransferase [Actinomycetota bacterium]
MEWLVISFERFILLYFAVLALTYAYFGYLGVRSVIVYSRELSPLALGDHLSRDVAKPVSILIPAFNEAASIVESVRSLLSMHFPRFELVVVNDGSTDPTLELLREHFALIEVPLAYRQVLPSREVRGIYRSLRYPNLMVIDKENGGRADALNAAINAARYPLVCAIDADTFLDADAVLRASRVFGEDETVVGIGGTIRPVNGAVVEDGQVTSLRVPKRWIERFQVIEYARAFFVGRAAWSKLSALMLISGAFSIFRKEALVAIDGYWTETVGEDMEVVFRLHRHYRSLGKPYKLLFTPDPIAWTEVPSDLRSLRAQRNRWQRGMLETLWRHRSMTFNPRFGRLGMLGVPHYWLFEAAAPVVEVLGYAALIVSAATGVLFAQFAVMFLLLALLYSVLFSQFAAGIESFLLARYPRTRDRMILLAASFLEFIGYRQILVFERFRACFQVRRKAKQWGARRRVGIREPAGR